MDDIVAATESLISQLFAVTEPRLVALMEVAREELLSMLDALAEAGAVDDEVTEASR